LNLAYKKKIINYLKSGTPAGFFERYLFRDFQEWQDISLKDIEEIMAQIKDYPLGLYAFLPFWYRHFGIDLYTYFQEYTVNDQNSENEMRFDGFPNDRHPSTERSILQPNNVQIEELLKVRQRLIVQGAKAVDRVRIEGSETKYYDFGG